MLIIHIISALASIAAVAVSLYSLRSLVPTYILTLSTLVTGAGLTIIQPDTISHVCVTGLVYLAVMIPLAVIAKRRQLAATSVTIR